MSYLDDLTSIQRDLASNYIADIIQSSDGLLNSQ